MTGVFTVDGTEYDVEVISLTRAFSILDSDSAGRLPLTGEMKRDIIGTFYNYTLAIDPSKLNMSDYTNLYQTISSPVNFHTVVLPYNQETLSFQAYIVSGSDVLFVDSEGKNHWSGLSINFVAKEPQRRPA